MINTFKYLREGAGDAGNKKIISASIISSVQSELRSKKIICATCWSASMSSESSQYTDFTTAATAGLMLSQLIF